MASVVIRNAATEAAFWIATRICFASWLRSSLGRLGWGFIIALQPPVNRADPPDILSGSLFRVVDSPEIRIQ
jgi:hypothetical protein